MGRRDGSANRLSGYGRGSGSKVPLCFMLVPFCFMVVLFCFVHIPLCLMLVPFCFMIVSILLCVTILHFCHSNVLYACSILLCCIVIHISHFDSTHFDSTHFDLRGRHHTTVYKGNARNEGVTQEFEGVTHELE